MARDYALGLIALLLAGCGTAPKEDPRIAQQCTDIRNVIGKNYELSASFKAPKTRAGLHVGPEYKLSDSAIDRQITLDRLCRQFAVGELSEELWAKAQTDLTLASTEGIKTNDPEALARLKKNLDELATLFAHLAESHGGSVGRTPTADALLAQVMSTTKQDFETIRGELDKLSTSFQTRMGASNKSVLDALESTNRQQTQLLAQVTELKELVKQFPAMKPQPSLLVADFKVKFSKLRAALDESAKSLLRRELSGLSGVEDFRIELDGYADSSGGPMTNIGLSWERASEVQTFLVREMRVDPVKVMVRGRGVRSAGPPAENRVVDIKAFASVPRAAATVAP